MATAKTLALATGLHLAPATYVLHHLDVGGPDDEVPLLGVAQTVGATCRGFETGSDVARFAKWYRVANASYTRKCDLIAEAEGDDNDPQHRLAEMIANATKMLKVQRRENVDVAREIIADPGSARSIELMERCLQNVKLWGPPRPRVSDSTASSGGGGSKSGAEGDPDTSSTPAALPQLEEQAR